MKQEAILEIGSSKISVYVGTIGRKNTLSVLSYADVDYAGYYDGQFVEPDNVKKAVALAIHNAEAFLKKKIKKIVVGVPSEFLINTVDEVGMESKTNITYGKRHIVELLKRAKDKVYLKDYDTISVSDVTYMIDDSMVLDPDGMKGKHLSIVLSFLLAEHKFIDFITKILYEVEVVDISFRSETLDSVMMIPESDREQGCIFIDSGHLTTTVCSVLNNGLMDLKTFSSGGGFILNDLMECLNVSYSEAEQLKRKAVLTLAPTEDDYYEIVADSGLVRYPSKIVNDIINSRIENMATIINGCIDSFTLEKKKDTTIYLCGGGLGYFAGISDILSHELNANVKILYPSQLQFRRPELNSCIGLLQSVTIKK